MNSDVPAAIAKNRPGRKPSDSKNPPVPASPWPPYQPNSCLVFDNETLGMPDRILEKYPDRCYTIPMSGKVRSLNLATAAGIVLYEAIRQTTNRNTDGPTPSTRRPRSR